MSETQTLTLAEFLLARIAEDEDVARIEVIARGVRRPSVSTPRVHADRWGAERVLAECEAKRQVVKILQNPAGGCDVYTADSIALALAQPYADHEQFRQEWRV